MIKEVSFGHYFYAFGVFIIRAKRSFLSASSFSSCPSAVLKLFITFFFFFRVPSRHYRHDAYELLHDEQYALVSKQDFLHGKQYGLFDKQR